MTPAPTSAARHEALAEDPRTAMAVRGLSKRFGGTLALDDFTLELRFGEVHALVGGNGSGKSTFIKALAGVYQGDSGTLEIGGETTQLSAHTPERARAAGLGFVHQDLGIFPTLSVAENLSIGHGFGHSRLGRIPWRRCEARAGRVMQRFHVEADPRAPAASLSVPQQAMLAIARALQDQDEETAGILVLDEPTAALSPSEVQLLLSDIRRLAAGGHAVMIVTHRLDEVRAVADRVTAVRDGRKVGTVETARLTESDMVHLILGRRLPQPKAVAARGAAREPVLDARDLRGGPLRGVTLHVDPGEIVGIAGLLGSGRSELLHTLFGALPRESGEIRLAGAAVARATPHEMRTRGMALVPEDRAGDALFPAQSVSENMTSGRVGRYFRGMWLREGAEAREVRADLARFTVKTESASTPIESLSGGNQQKVVLARWLRDRPRLLLLDEPTQGIDVGAREEIFALIEGAAESGTGVLLVSSEFEELARLCHRVVLLSGGRIVGQRSAPMSSHDLLEGVLEAVRSVPT